MLSSTYWTYPVSHGISNDFPGTVQYNTGIVQSRRLCPWSIRFRNTHNLHNYEKDHGAVQDIQATLSRTMVFLQEGH